MKIKEVLKNKKVIASGTAVALVLGIATIGAYFTDTNSVSNIFTTGGVTSELTEPNWNPEDAKLIGPNKTLPKDPTVTNKDTLDMYSFIKVTVPVKEVKTVNEQSGQVETARQPLFTWKVNDGWTLVKSVENADSDAYEYFYGYGSSDAMTPINPGESTNPVFNEITFINVLEGQGLENTELEVDVEDLSIQTTDLPTTEPAGILEAFLGQNTK